MAPIRCGAGHWWCCTTAAAWNPQDYQLNVFDRIRVILVSVSVIFP